MKWRKLLNLLAGAIVVGTIGGVISSLIEVISQRYLPYQMYLLALLTIQETLNRSLIMVGGAVFLGGLLLIWLHSRRNSRRSIIMVVGVLAGLFCLDYLLIGYSYRTIFSITKHTLTRFGNILNGIISLSYFLKLLVIYRGSLSTLQLWRGSRPGRLDSAGSSKIILGPWGTPSENRGGDGPCSKIASRLGYS